MCVLVGVVCVCVLWVCVFKGPLYRRYIVDFMVEIPLLLNELSYLSFPAFLHLKLFLIIIAACVQDNLLL